MPFFDKYETSRSEVAASGDAFRQEKISSSSELLQLWLIDLRGSGTVAGYVDLFKVLTFGSVSRVEPSFGPEIGKCAI